MTIAYLSPFPPVRSGVSEYSAELLPELHRLLDLRAFGEHATPQLPSGHRVEGPDAFDRAEFPLIIYHVGNNLHHRWIHRRALRRPGLLVLHDTVLHHYQVEDTLGSGRAQAYVELMEEVYGEHGRAAAMALWHDVSSEAALFCFPLFEPVVASSLGVLVHNHRAAALIRSRVRDVPVRVVEMGIPDPEADPLPSREASRASLGVDPRTFLIGMFGFMTPIKRPHIVLRAFAAVAGRLPHARLVLVGEEASSLRLEKLIGELGLEGRATRLGYVPYEIVKRWVSACDLFLNLRYPTAGETSASLLRLLGWGKPVVVSDYAQFREIPEEAAIRVALGPAEQAEVAELLLLLAERPELSRAVGQAAARHVRSHHRLSDTARAYADLVEELARARPAPRGRLVPPPPGRTSRTPCRPRARIEALPLAGSGEPGAPVRLEATLTNTGDTRWLKGPFPEGGYAVFGGYLRRPSGEGVQDLGSVLLERDVAPGGRVKVQWCFPLPALPGSLELVAGVRIVGWGWLHGRGSESVVYRLDGERGLTRPEPAQ